MIDLSDFRSKIETYISANFSLVPVLFENTTLASEDEEHITIDDTIDSSESLDMSGSALKVDGYLTIEINIQRGQGTETAKVIASELINLLTDYEPASFYNPRLLSRGAVEGEPFYGFILTVPYMYVYGQQETTC